MSRYRFKRWGFPADGQRFVLFERMAKVLKVSQADTAAATFRTFERAVMQVRKLV